MSNDSEWLDLTFEGRTAVVTGGARGIGRAIVYRLAGLGARTFIFDSDAPESELAAATLSDLLEEQGRPHDVQARTVDVTHPQSVAHAFGSAVDGGGLNVLVNNAGTTSVHKTEDITDEEWHRIVGVNLTGTFFCCRAAIPHMRRQGGSAIVNISSSSASVGGGGGAHYAASKAGVDGLTRYLARELAPGIRVNSIQPRTIETDLLRARYANAPEAEAQLLELVPLRRIGQPRDIADTVAFLASDWASYITGQVVLVDGGRTYQ